MKEIMRRLDIAKRWVYEEVIRASMQHSSTSGAHLPDTDAMETLAEPSATTVTKI